MDERKRKLLLLLMLLQRIRDCIRDASVAYYYTYLYKEVSLTKKLTGQEWMEDLLSPQADPQRCVDAFRMDKELVLALSHELQANYGLQQSNISVVEKVGIFLYTLARGASNRDVKERFQHSGQTISRVFHEVLDAFVGRKKGFKGLASDLIKPMDPEFRDTPARIKGHPKYDPYFKDCIGCIDGTHISACVPDRFQKRFRNRKGVTTFNVMGICDFDMCFTYVCAGWEGSAHDARVLNHALSTPELKFPHPPPGKYYVVDKGYPDRDGFLTPYPRLRYHLDEFATKRPKNEKEAFNRAHSSLRSCIERTFGVMKKRWKITTCMPAYGLDCQTDITLACFALHNYVRRHNLPDVYMQYARNDPAIAPEFMDSEPASIPAEEQVPLDQARGMMRTRDNIAKMLWNERRHR